MQRDAIELYMQMKRAEEDVQQRLNDMLNVYTYHCDIHACTAAAVARESRPGCKALLYRKEYDTELTCNKLYAMFKPFIHTLPSLASHFVRNPSNTSDTLRESDIVPDEVLDLADRSASLELHTELGTIDDSNEAYSEL